MMKWTMLLAMSLLSTALFATGRTIPVVPIEFSSNHGGVMKDGTILYGCISSNMLKTYLESNYPGSDNGVQVASQAVHFKFRNISNTIQHLSIQLESGYVNSSYSTVSDPIGQRQSPGVKGLSMTFDPDTKNIILQPNSSAQVVYYINFGADNGGLVYVDEKNASSIIKQTGGLNVNNSMAGNRPCICLRQESAINFSVKIDEDRGAVIGSITTSTHRGGGVADTNYSTPYTVLINGGRAF